MPIYYIAGISGSGKSSLVEALKENGYDAYDADSELCSWFDGDGVAVEYPRNAADRPVDWQDHHRFLMSEQKVQKLAAKDEELFICGIVKVPFFRTPCLFPDEHSGVSRWAHF
jgi:predicted ATPase